jgi:hypothetical protein
LKSSNFQITANKMAQAFEGAQPQVVRGKQKFKPAASQQANNYAED